MQYGHCLAPALASRFDHRGIFMRAFLIVPVLLVAGCSDEPPPPKAQAAAVDKIDAGQWETNVEVTSLTSVDKTKPAIDTPPGTKTQGSACVAEGERQKPPPQLFTATKDKCVYGDFYMSGGTINASMTCTNPKLKGSVMMTVNGSYDARSFEGSLNTNTYLAGNGDVTIGAKVHGRRTGACTASGE
jgi:hypothetical protein